MKTANNKIFLMIDIKLLNNFMNVKRFNYVNKVTIIQKIFNYERRI